MLRLLIILLLACISTASAQVLPSTRTVTFRLFGADARPITEKDREYSVTIKGIRSYSIMAGPTWSGNMVGYEGDEYSISPTPELVIARGADTMVVNGSDGIDSLRFMPGHFYIPPEYMKLLTIGRYGARLAPTLESFRVGADTSWMARNAIDLGRARVIETHTIANITEEQKLPLELVDIAMSRRSGTLVAIVGNPRYGVWELFRGERMGESWQKVEHPFGQSHLLRVVVSDGAFLLYGSNGSTLLARSNDDGRSWSAQSVPEGTLPPSRHDPRSNVELGTPNNGIGYVSGVPFLSQPWRLWRREDSVNPVRMLLRGAGSPGLLRFHDDRLGALLTWQYMLMTTDGGESWRYRPFDFMNVRPQANQPTFWQLIGWTDFAFVDERTILAFRHTGAALIRLD